MSNRVAAECRIEDVRSGDELVNGSERYHVLGVERVLNGGPRSIFRVDAEAMQGGSLGSNDTVILDFEPGATACVVRDLEVVA